jgi:hypothetical protein
MAVAMDAWMQSVSDARAKGDMHAVKWLTACWMPYPLTMRQAAKAGTAHASHAVSEPPAPTGPIRNGKIVFHPSTMRRSDTPTE